MDKLCKFIKNCEGVSDVVGDVLLIGIVVLLFSVIGVSVLSHEWPVVSPSADLQVWLDEASYTIYLKNMGGETFDTDDLKVVVFINGTEKVLSPENISVKLGGSEIWKMGDVIEIGIMEDWGIPLDSGDPVNLFLVHTPSKQVIQRMEVTFS